jgi:MoxR-like ATPase
VDYPTLDEEVDILLRTTGAPAPAVERILDATDMVRLQALVREVEISEALLQYVAALVRATRPDHSDIEGVRNYLRWGAGPRAGQALVLCAKAHAVMQGRFAVTLADLRAIAPAALRHRLLLNFQAEADGVTTDDIVTQVFDGVGSPTSRLD